jgi:phosphoribulokinase
MISSLLDETQEFTRKLITTEDRTNRASHRTSPTIDALVRVNKKLIITLVNTLDRTHLNATRVFAADTRLSNHREVIHDLEYGRGIQQCP